MDNLTAKTILQHQLNTFKISKKDWVPTFTEAYEYVLRGLRTSHNASKTATAEHGEDSVEARTTAEECAAWAKLAHLTACILLAPDGRVRRTERFMHFAQGTWPSLLQSTLEYFDKAAARARNPRNRRARISNFKRTIREPGGISRTAHAIMSNSDPQAPRDQATLDKLKTKHPAGPTPQALAAEAAHGTATATAKLAAPTAAHTYSKLDEVFTVKSIRSAIMSTDTGVSPGLSSLRMSHLQLMVRRGDSYQVERILSHLTWLARTVFDEPDTLPEPFWDLFRAARLSAVGSKARPIACGDTLRRLFCRVFAAANKQRFARMFEPVGQFGVAVPGGVDKLGLMAQLIHEAGGTLVAVDGRNAFNSVCRLAVLKQAASLVPEAYALIRKLYGDESKPSLMFGMEGQAHAELVLSQEGVQQGDPLGPLLFALALLPLMQEFKQRFPELALPGFLDDLTICIVTRGELPDELAAVREAYEWLVPKLQAVGIEVNTDKTTCLLPADASNRVPAEHADRVHEYASELLGGIKVTTDAGMILVGSPVGDDVFSEQAVASTLQCDQADDLLHAVAGMRDTQAAFTLLRMCYLSRATFINRNARPSVTDIPLQRFDAAVQAAMAALMQEPVAATETGYNNDNQRDEFSTCFDHIRSQDWAQTDLRSATTCFSPTQQSLLRLPPKHGGFGLCSQHRRRHACFTARTVACIQAVMMALPVSIRTTLSPVVMTLPTLISLQSSVAALCTQDGIDAKTLAVILPAEVVSWALPEQAAAAAAEDEAAGAVIDADTDVQAVMLHWLYADPDAAEKPLRPRLQKVVGTEADNIAAEQHLSSLGVVQWPLVGDVGSDTHTAGLKVLKDRTRYNGMSSTGAAAFLTTVPSRNRHLTMEPRHWRESMRRWLGIERPDPGGLCPNLSCTHMLTAELARRCSLTGEQNSRHDPVRDMIYDTLKDSTRLPGVRKEDNTKFIASGHDGLRMDVTWPPGHMFFPLLDEGGNELPYQQGHDKRGGLADVSLVDSSSQILFTVGVANKKGPAFKSGAALNTRLREKYTTYGGKHPSNYTLIPLILEHTGASCPHVQVFIKAVAKHEHMLSGGAYAQGTIVHRWRQKISVTVQKVLSVTTERCYLRARKVVGQVAAPDKLIHERVHLLRTPVALQLHQQQQQQVDNGLDVGVGDQ